MGHHGNPAHSLFIQAGWLTTSDYSGTLSKAAPDRLLTWFVPTLFTGAEPAAPWNTLLPMIGIAALVVALVPWWRQDRSLVGWLAAYILLPTAILALAATRMSVFHPRYLLAISPALLILLALAITLPARSTRPTQTWIAARATILLIPLLGIMQLGSYYQGENAKSPDWPHLAQYLEASAAPDDIILHTVPDPAFNYYYDGATPETSLTAGQPLTGQLAALTQNHRTIWFVGNRADVQSALSDTYQQLTQQQIGTFTVTQYRDPHVAPAEIVLPQDVSFDGIARLAGVTLQGPDPITHHLTVLLYWEPLRQAETGYTVFVHLIGPFHGPDNTPLWSQDDHPPQYDAASTTHWTPGELLRDPYTLDLSTVPDGPYTLNIGLYDPANPAERLAITNSDSTSQGDSFPSKSPCRAPPDAPHLPFHPTGLPNYKQKGGPVGPPIFIVSQHC